MTSKIDLGEADVALIEKCDSFQQVRNFENNLYVQSKTGSEFVVPRIQYSPLIGEQPRVRLLRLHPTNNISENVHCDLEIHDFSQMPPFIAVQNARGYRKIEEAIEVVHGGVRRALIISAALERFLRYLRTRVKEPTHVWVRYACVLEFHLLEQQTYWTREFSDKMYAAASKIFDMHEINSRLIENGYFERCLDSRYAEWKKEWYGRPDETVLPRVCPVRLGTRPENDSPTMRYRYMPLDMVADEIRIVCVMPADDEATPIVMHVAHCPMKCEVNYIALSYRWGTNFSPEQVVLNGQTKTIGKNLAQAIRSLRMKQAIIPLWIDALSINQEDEVERSRQVRRMGEIYDNAMSVYSWVGSKQSDTDKAIDLMLELEKHPVIRFNDRGGFDLGVEPTELPRLCAALYKFMSRQYFRRTWILQEVALASNPTVFAGCERAITFDTLDKAACNLHDMLTRDPAFIAQILACDDSLDELNIQNLAYARKIFYFRYLVSGGLGGGSMLGLFYRISTSSPGFLEALVLARDFECTDPRDRIYGLWNLAQDRNDLDLVPGYSMPHERVYAEFAKTWAVKHASLDILGAVEAAPESAPFYKTAPSWCPNWSVPATASCLIRKDYLPARFTSAMRDQGGRLYSADGNIRCAASNRPIFSFQGDALHCTGIIIDRLSGMLSDAPDIPAGSAPKSTWQFHYWTHRLQQLYRRHNPGVYDDIDRAICAMLHGDTINAWPEVAESGYDLDEFHSSERFVCLPAASRHILRHANSYDRTEAWSVVQNVLRGRRPILTEDGLCGLGPAYVGEENDENSKTWTSAGWQLAIVAGCSVPLLLREREDGTYQLIGSCFVQGWMDGEWIRLITGADNAIEFWLAIKEGKQLVIT